MGIKFDDSIINDYAHPQTVKESFLVYGNWAGIHEFNFENDLSEDEIILSRIATSSWNNYTLIQQAVPSDILLEFDILPGQSANDGVGIIVAWDKTERNAAYIIGIRDGNVFLGRFTSTTMTTVTTRPLPFSVTTGHFKLAVRQQFYSSEETDLWLSFSLWVNDALVDTWTVYTGAPIEFAPYIGFAFYGATSEFVINNVRVPQLSAFVDWNSIDPGETALGGLQRSIEGRYLKYHVRYNGALRGWRSRPTDLVRIFDRENEIYVNSTTKDKRRLYNHVRILGAYVEAEYVAGNLLKRGHRFTEINNPYVMTVADCYAEAKNQVRIMVENSLVENLSTPFTPLIEPEDRIETLRGGRTVNNRQWNFIPGTVDQTIDARLYGFTEGMKIYYVDSVAGDDDNVGTQQLPFQSLSGLPALGAGDIVYVARGSTFTESFKPTVNNISLLAYGSGDAPVFQCADVFSMSGAVLEALTTNVYMKEILSPNATAQSWHSVFEDGVRLQRVSSIATCDALPGSYFLYTESTGPEIYIHASDSSNIGTNGKVYSVSVRDGVNFSELTGCVVKGIRVENSLNLYGGILLGRNCQADSVEIIESSFHAVSLKEEASLKNFTITGLHAYGSDSSAIYCRDEDAAGLDILIETGSINEGQIKLAGLAALGSETLGNVMGIITMKDVVIEGCELLTRCLYYNKIILENVDYDGLVDSARIGIGVHALYNAEIELINCTMTNCLNFVITGDESILTITGCTFDFAGNMDDAGIYLSHDTNISIQECSFTKSGAGSNQHMISGVGTIEVFVGIATVSFFGDGRLWTFPDTDVDVTVLSQGNCLVADREFELNGIYYADLAAVQVDGYEVDTTIGGC